MRVKVVFYGYCRKDGTCNSVSFDTNTKVFCNSPSMRMLSSVDVIVPTEKSGDVNAVRYALAADGYREIFVDEDDDWVA